MPTLLVIEVSPRFENSTSRMLTRVFVEEWRTANSGGTVITRDLVKTTIPFVDLSWIDAAALPPEARSPKMSAAIKLSDELISELKSADRIVIGTPMFNFAIPASLKAYIDQIVRVGLTVSADNQGLLTGKLADVIVASGGDFSPDSPVQKYDQATGYIRQLLAWIGITDLNIILAGRAVAGPFGETAVENFGGEVKAAAVRDAQHVPA
jgi:FMN-dependent NADH-azoreductase